MNNTNKFLLILAFLILLFSLNLCLAGLIIAINNQEVGGEECESALDCFDLYPLGYKICALIAIPVDVVFIYFLNSKVRAKIGVSG